MAGERITIRQLQTQLLLRAGRLLLEYNESTRVIDRALTQTAKALTEDTCHVLVSYSGVAVSLAGAGAVLEPVSEIRYNMALQARVHEILEQVCRGSLDAAAALARLEQVEADTPRHARWLAAVVLGCAAASLAALLGADVGALTVAGLATALGLLARQELGRRHYCLLALPLTAAFIGAVLGGLVIRLGWTRSPELAVIVPALMLVPGPHLINGLFDLIDNHLPMSSSRLGLAVGALLASAMGVILGVEITLPDPIVNGQGDDAGHLNLVSDVVLAGVATCGFAIFYNTAWRQVWMAMAGGMAGHGFRFLALEAGCPLEAATFLGGLAVGVIAAWMARSSKTPVAVLAFAGAVTMIPGLSLYRALGSAVRLARLPNMTDPATAAQTIGNALQGCVVVSGLVLGLILGARAVLALVGERDSAMTSYAGQEADEEGTPRLAAEPVDQSANP
jgi:uncharacterized membrane protein YjjP (DUF1212 family)